MNETTKQKYVQVAVKKKSYKIYVLAALDSFLCSPYGTFKRKCSGSKKCKKVSIHHSLRNR